MESDRVALVARNSKSKPVAEAFVNCTLPLSMTGVAGGTIIRTIDGEHWTLVSAPTTDNLVAVSASGANVATVTTAGGRSFATSDGGASWHPQ